MFVLKATKRIPTKVNGEWIVKYRTETIATSPIITHDFREMAINEEIDSERVWIEEV